MSDQQSTNPVERRDAAWTDSMRRVFREKNDLDERISKRSAEASACTDPSVRALIRAEVTTMQHRSNILKERLGALVSS